MINLSVNINKIATVRNSRGGNRPSPLWAAKTCIEAGVQGITVHPRADARHIRFSDVRDLAAMLNDHPRVEFNIEGDPRPELIDLLLEVKPDQATLVPVRPGEITSDHGYRFPETVCLLVDTVKRLKEAGIRVSVFVEAGVKNLEAARKLGIDRIELYTEPYARACEQSDDAASRSFEGFCGTAQAAMDHGLGINAGHDLDLSNLPRFRTLPGLMEVSIGHALISDALEIGLGPAVKAYLAALAAETGQ